MLKEIAILVYNASLRPYDKLSFTRMCFENSVVAEIQKLFFFLLSKMDRRMPQIFDNLY